MADFGHFALCVAWLLALYGFLAGAYAGRTKKRAWFLSVRNSTMLTGLALLFSTAALGILFCSNDYTNQFVWQFSNRNMPVIYKISAIWGGMDGSMLLWAAILGGAVSIVAYTALNRSRDLMPWVLSAANSTTLFFTTVVLFVTNPFRYIQTDFIPPDGNGLNPLLQNPYMAAHPPMLYLGFTTYAIPYAFCMGALLSGNLSNEWVRLTRRWTLIAWTFLTIGICLGAHWAYLELGWGGFWAWDPVENASFLPWLTGTAFLHSVMVQERKDMLKMWNVWLIVLTYGLTVFGTFLTRSGVVQSVHSFASTDIGWVFLLYLGIVFGGTLALTFFRRRELASERKIESLLSREAAFLVNNLIFLTICFAVLWGVMFPVFVEAFTGNKQTVGIPFFNAVNVPLFLLLIFVMGVGPLIAWRKASTANLKKSFLTPFVSAFLVGILLVWIGITDFYPVLAYSLCFFVTMTILGELHRGMRAQRAMAGNSALESAVALVRRHRSRYAGHLVHFGVVIATVAITSSMAFKTEKELSLGKGESVEIGRFKLTLQDLADSSTGNYEGLSAVTSLSLLKSGEELSVLKPELRVYRKNNESTSEVALRIGMKEDFYLVLAGLDPTGTRAALKVFINPLQIWLWLGALIMAAGTVITVIPARGALRASASKLSVEGVKA